MDGFTDRLSQHFSSPQEMIAANGQAEATQVEQLQAEVKALIVTLNDKISQLSTAEAPSAAATEDYAAQITGVGDKLESHIHKENVKVYRNVQASVTDELGKQTEALSDEMTRQNQAVLEKLTNQTEMLAAMMETLNEQQKSQGESLSNMAGAVVEMQNTVKKKIRSKAVLPLQIIMLLLVLADLAINVLLTLGLL